MIKDADIFHHCDVKVLPVSIDLKDAIQAWDDEYQSTFNADYPPDSGFALADMETAHIARGREIARRLQIELGDRYQVEYKS